MKQYILLLFIMIPLLSYGKTDMEKLLERVDHAIEMDSYYQQQKEKELKRLRRQAGDAITAEERLCYLDSLYRAYSNYRYDSSCAYVSKGLQLAEATHNTFLYYSLQDTPGIRAVGGRILCQGGRHSGDTRP